MGKALHIVSVTRLLTHVTLDKGAQRPKPPLQKGGWGIGNISKVARHHYIKGKQKSPPFEGRLYI